jgi:hypothetical protein
MIAIARLAGWITGAAVAAMLMTPAVAAARQPPTLADLGLISVKCLIWKEISPRSTGWGYAPPPS